MLSKQDQELLDAFRLMDKDEREFFLEMAQTHTDGRKRRPELTLINCGAALASAGGSSSSGLS